MTEWSERSERNEGVSWEGPWLAVLICVGIAAVLTTATAKATVLLHTD